MNNYISIPASELSRLKVASSIEQPSILNQIQDYTKKIDAILNDKILPDDLKNQLFDNIYTQYSQFKRVFLNKNVALNVTGSTPINNIAQNAPIISKSVSDTFSPEPSNLNNNIQITPNLIQKYDEVENSDLESTLSSTSSPRNQYDTPQRPSKTYKYKTPKCPPKTRSRVINSPTEKKQLKKDLLTEIPPKYKSKAEMIVDYILDSPAIKMTTQGTVLFNGALMPNVTMKPIITALSGNSRSTTPEGTMKIAEYLINKGMPLETINNKITRRQIKDQSTSQSYQGVYK